MQQRNPNNRLEALYEGQPIRGCGSQTNPTRDLQGSPRHKISYPLKAVHLSMKIGMNLSLYQDLNNIMKIEDSVEKT